MKGVCHEQIIKISGDVPSGKPNRTMETHHFFMGKSTISMAILIVELNGLNLYKTI